MPPSVLDQPPKLDIKLRLGQAFMNVVKCESLRDKWLTASCLMRIIESSAMLSEMLLTLLLSC
jgi:hypothetical protein